ncbi:hypothetical protein [Streptomyces cyaneofuscatus]|uniref:hypothetical protein n=1 Tax=Streptomyces cyaneofuscatus TaxID=66883 RepID=UPI00332089B3
MRQNQEGLAARRDAPPPGADLTTARSQVPGEVAQMATGQIDRRWVDKHAKLLVGTGDLGREPVYQELHRFA